MLFRKAIIFCLLIFFLIGAIYLLDMWRNRFSLENISYDSHVFYEPSQDVVPLSESIREILAQPLTYLDKGNQSFAFESADRKYVLKFFKFSHLKKCKQPFWIPSFLYPDHFEKKCAARRAKKLRRLFSSHALAFQEDASQSGLLYVQLYPNVQPLPTVNLKDRFGISHAIDLGQTRFVLQYKAIPTHEYLQKLIDDGQIDEVIKSLNLLIDLYVGDYQRGIIDNDHNLMHNTGFVDGRPIRMDIGKLAANVDVKNPSVFMKDLEKIVENRIDKWFKRYDATDRDRVRKAMKDKLEAINKDVI